MKWLKSTYSHLVFILLLRRKRKLRFLISNFKHSTGLFELALPYSAGGNLLRKCYLQPCTVTRLYKLSAAIEANFVRYISNLQRFPEPLERVLKVN
ncbi:hypothetical protein F6P74_01685 [Streptococcus suis]|nr:hypothetical protein [Streptococcus suis]MBS8094202.1 hypothetical protein [Streptococcus suis]MBS8102240.1 hypothetical protein [Streptococcus suis]TQE46540.1 hypothetical protein FH690_01750 [Streptococcus suis]